jgi:hypothetical protein
MAGATPVVSGISVEAAPAVQLAPAQVSVAPGAVHLEHPAVIGQAPTVVTAPPADAVPSLAPVDRSRPQTHAAVPPTPLVTSYAPDIVEHTDRSRPAPAGATAVRPPAPALPGGPLMPEQNVWVDQSLPTTPASFPSVSLGGSVAGGQFGAAPPRGGFSAGSSHDFSAVGHAGDPHPSRHIGRTLLILALGLAIVAAFCVVAVPRYLVSRDQGIAAQQPDVLSRTAPATLAGQKRARQNDAAFAGAAKDLRSQGAAWSWSTTYGHGSALTSYLAADVPLDSRDDAVRALSSHDAASALLASVSKPLFAPAGGTVVLGTATEYASPVGGKTWCMQVTASGIADGYCLWTNGKEWLAVLSTPGLETTAGKSTLTALAQLARISTRTPAKPRP